VAYTFLQNIQVFRSVIFAHLTVSSRKITSKLRRNRFSIDPYLQTIFFTKVADVIPVSLNHFAMFCPHIPVPDDYLQILLVCLAFKSVDVCYTRYFPLFYPTLLCLTDSYP
jgi:hypothetical protein